MLRNDHMEAMALNEELQAKISTIQSAANATINDLVAELTHAEDLLKADQARRAQDDELLRSQCRYVEDDLKRKEVEWKEATMMLKRELAVRRDNYDSLETKYQKQKEMLEAKKVEVDKLTKDNEHRQLKLAELERKLAPLANIKESTATRLSEMKLVCNKLLKSTLDRTKLELHHATDNVATLAQRLDAQQNASNATIADLSGRLQGLDQQYQAALASLSRELTVEKEKCQDHLVQKHQLMKQLRKLQRPGSTTSSSTSSSDDLADQQVFTSRTHPELADYATSSAVTPVAKTSPRSNTNVMACSYNLTNIPVALLRAQIGLDMCSFDKLSHNNNNNTTTSNQVPEGVVPSLNLDNLNRWGCMSRLSTPSLVELSHRMESALSQRSSSHDEASGKLKAKTYSKSTTTKDTLKLIKKKIKQDDNKLKATASLPKLV
ncbi:hypothetical protein DYB36_003996 [Aphanomyces astaci]|uniref:Uncharacterized protein n=1 Tax=Aphanomyces astaci TaxID=112090 RepID=A0A397BID8_APHAT|nr:hypothetical protein DYB36_003996 [Aphanomyces astaci]